MRLWPLFVGSLVFLLGLTTDIEARKIQHDLLKLDLLYEGVDHELIWLDEEGISLNAMVLIGILDDLGIYTDIGSGLYKDLDIRLKDRLYSSALLDLLERISFVKGRDASNERANLLEVIKNGELSAYIDRILPTYDEVSKIRHMIRVYKTQLDLDWPSMTLVHFKLGQSSKKVLRLRWMLTVLGDIKKSELTIYRKSIYDPVVIHGIKSFQRRHGLTVNGTLDEPTVLALNISPKQRVIQMQQNLWRWIMLPSSPPDKYIKINIPDYTLELYVLGELDLTMKVIVGKPSSPTPVLLTQITGITINPYWTPSINIIRSELLPLNSRKPGYLNHKGFELHPVGKNLRSVVKLSNVTSKQLTGLLKRYRLVQSPGEKNALGKLRFTIPNTKSIFLHDTPVKKLFEGENLALSHGCIRLEKAQALSEYILSTKNEAKEIRRALNGLNTKYVSLSDPMLVFIIYLTAWVDNSGKLQLRPDIYHLDTELITGL
ncbi:L,D-transpeptidase family protein [Shewanella surugensis]|uniref:L,D-transpeptidase family protein n=1 Tax=Shewanella surugensis TaxID=212020 RepID=A0ABT0LJH0_9GAMM|nr:L,D-transpeptidase family protein [Shewanella surugensis]MCL1127734.1 L,D-transpeptidase family protein [Shewanella surugensis]